MDEQTWQMLAATYQGMTAEELEDALLASKHADKIQDVKALAAYLCDAFAAS